MLSVQLDPDIEKRLAELARKSGRTEDACARELIEEHIDDLEERYAAEARLSRPLPSLTSQQVRKDLGLKD